MDAKKACRKMKKERLSRQDSKLESLITRLHDRLPPWPADEEGTPYSLSDDGGAMYLGTSLRSDTQELRLLDVGTRIEKTLASNPEVDLGEGLFHPTEYQAAAVRPL